ncbi:mRNA-capping enzyme [Aricia agestis]|uniref:mRNA-capping enzyme n=1 Tax=Aricia agestis TaxID=91739 RepID=UPI001C20C42B|nr:mRNA-capping enzyme [Aricia agestis]
MSSKDPGAIPSRWLNCPPLAIGLIAEQLLAFKTPLGTQFNEKIPQSKRFTPLDVFKHVQNMKMKLGLWIDLTNTSRFYDKSDIERMNCKYLKLKCRGHGETPSPEQTKKFIETVAAFTEENPNLLVGVHCTHGFNRTGFLLVAYMIDQLCYTLFPALKEFANVREPGIYKQDYLDELFNRYKDTEDEDDIQDKVPIAPEKPDWCYEEDEFDDEDEEPSTNKPTSSSKPPRRRQKIYKNKTFMAGVGGAEYITTEPLMSEVQDKVRRFCKWEGKNFPGSQPVSMDMENIRLLQKKPYQVSWKADGVRYMMLIDGDDRVFMIDRDNCVFRIRNLTFLHNKECRSLTNTLLDGEMVIDKSYGVDKARYLCYDIIRFEDMNVGREPFFPVRLSCIQKEIIRPRDNAIINGTIKKEEEPFRVALKQFWDVSLAHQLLSERFTRTLAHEPDGLIFQPSKDPYIAGACDQVLKWKPPDMNSIDFLLKIVEIKKEGMLPEKLGYLYVNGFDKPFAAMKSTKALRPYDNKIVECKYENGQWKFMRERTDKSYPNKYETAMAVWESIRHPVTKDYLLSFIDQYTYQASNYHH